MHSPTSTLTTSFPPLHKHRTSPRIKDDEDASPSPLRATSRENGIIARNRRRSLSQIALLDSLPTQTPSSPSPSLSAIPPHSRSQSRSSSLSAATLADTLLPTLSPAAQSHFEAYSPDKVYLPGQPKSLAGIALRAFGLGAAATFGTLATLATLFGTSSPLWRLPFFLATLATFHMLEFWTTARYNTRAADVDSFLLTANWPAYAIAHTAAALECLLTNLLWPAGGGAWAWVPYAHAHLGLLVMLLGVALVAVGQLVRTAAMIQAGQSFNHIVQQKQKPEHVLVTTGIYGSLRHPSYFGFFWWGLGTQLAMGNVVCLVAYAAVLWRFFSTRVRHEEQFLVKFFGDEYVDYRKKVGTKIPFVP